VRRNVADLMCFSIQYREPATILDRYAELMTINAARRKHANRPVTVNPVQEQLWTEVCL
jgi:hypothetical protein